jgi:hypothetical protein
VLDPAVSVDTCKDCCEDGRADQDVDGHRGQFERCIHAAPEQLPGQPSAHGGQADRTQCAHRARFGRCRQSQEDGSQHQEDQGQRRDHADENASPQWPATRHPLGFRDRRHLLGPHQRQERDVDDEEQDLHHRRPERADVHVAHRPAELIGKDDENQRRRYQLGDRAGSCDDAGGQARAVAEAQHDRQRDDPHGDDRGGNRPGDCTEDGADEDHRMGQPACDAAEQLAHPLEQVFGQPATIQHGPHESEERNGQQQFIGQDAEDSQRQGVHELRREHPEEHRGDAEEEAEGAKREGHRIPQQEDQDHAGEHRRRHPLGAHCAGFS